MSTSQPPFTYGRTVTLIAVTSRQTSGFPLAKLSKTTKLPDTCGQLCSPGSDTGVVAHAVVISCRGRSRHDSALPTEVMPASEDESRRPGGVSAAGRLNEIA